MVVRAALIRMLVSRAVALVIMAAGFAVLGRLVAPAAFGHFALALAIFTLAESVVQFGLRQYLIRSETEISRATIEAAAGLSLVLAASAAALGLAAAATSLAGLLPRPAAAALVPLSLALLIGPFVLGTEALLHRSLRFGLVSVAEVARVAIDAAVSIALTLAGFGAVAMASGVLASRLGTAVLLLAFAGRETRARPRIGPWRGFTGFGGRMTAIQILPVATDLAMVSILSGVQGAAVLGLFNRARTIHRLLDRTLFEGIGPVVLPAMSDALRQGAPPRRLYLVQVEYLAAICWPGFALIALLAEPLVAVLLGPQWDAAVPAVQVLALMGLTMPFTKMSQRFFVAMGETRAFLRFQVLEDAVRLPLAALGAFVSLPAFAAAFVVANAVKAVAIARHVGRRHGRGGREVLRAARVAAAMTLATLAGPALVLAAGLGPLATLGLGLVLGGAGWLAAAAALAHPVIGEMRQALS
jgi:O-antigen/teichoic acid export membrane protein